MVEAVENILLKREQIAAVYGVPAELLTADSLEGIEGQAIALKEYLTGKGAGLSHADQFAQWMQAQESAPFLQAAQDAGIMEGVRDGGEVQHIPTPPTTREQFANFMQGII